MKMGPVEPISLGQFFLMVAVTVVAGGVYIWPSAVLAEAGQGALWGTLASIGLALGLVWLQSLWPPATQGASAVTRMRAVWGWGRWPLFTVTVGVYLTLGGSLIALFSQLLHVNFYSLTPLWVFEGTIVVAIAWLAAQSVSHVARNVQFWFPLIMASFLLLAFMALPHLRHAAAMRPASVIRIPAIAKTLASTWYLWVQGEVIVTLGAHVRDTPWTRIRHWALAAIAVQGAVLLTVYGLVVGILGPDAPIRLEWPLIYIFSNLSVPTLFISRPGLLIIIAWVVALILYEAVTLMVLTMNVQEGLALSERTRRMVVWISASALGGLATRIATPLQANHLVLHWIDPIALALTLFSSLCTPGLLYLRRHRQAVGNDP